MSVRVSERAISIDADASTKPLTMAALERAAADALAPSEIPVRLAVTDSLRRPALCEVGVLEGVASADDVAPLFAFRRRRWESQAAFNAAFIVPTGVGAEIGGHAGDATPAAMLLAQVADTLITHPNVVNASDINELPANGMYVEGSVLTRLLMGTVGLRAARSNRVLVALDASFSERFAEYSVNAVNAARAAYGLNCAGVIRIKPPLKLAGGYAESGRAAGSADGLDGLLDILADARAAYDAVAIASVVEVPAQWHCDYFTGGGEMVNPWGGVEALLTHAVSSIIDAPAAHAPMMESDEIMAVDPGVVDARMAAEIISVTFLQSVLKGLRNAPRIETDPDIIERPDVLSAEDVSCLITPDGCLGLPHLAALRQGIPVIAVRENRNLMRNDLTRLAWAPGQLRVVENYWEAAGVVAALRAGINPDSARRPIAAMRARRRGR